MTLKLSSTFTDSLARLTAGEQGAIKTTVLDLHMNSSAHRLSFHKLDRARDNSFRSVRVSSDIRSIVHRSESLLLCCVHHPDESATDG